MASANELLGAALVSEVQVWTAAGPIQKRRRDPAPSIRAADGDDAARKPSTDDPEEAFDRARSAWLRRRSKPTSEGSSGASRKPENPW
jgi:hypothetical protein